MKAKIDNEIARMRNARKVGVELSGNVEVDEMRMMVRYGMKPRSLREILDHYTKGDWTKLVATLSPGNSPSRR